MALEVKILNQSPVLARPSVGRSSSALMSLSGFEKLCCSVTASSRSACKTSVMDPRLQALPGRINVGQGHSVTETGKLEGGPQPHSLSVEPGVWGMASVMLHHHLILMDE